MGSQGKLAESLSVSLQGLIAKSGPPISKGPLLSNPAQTLVLNCSITIHATENELYFGKQECSINVQNRQNNTICAVWTILMPVMDGYESSREIKAFDPKAKILVMTGNPNDTRAQKVLKEDMAFALLQKPYSLNDLGRIILENLPAYS